MKEKILNTFRSEESQQRREAAQDDYDNAPERDLDDLRTDDREILGEVSGFIRGRARKKTDKIMERLGSAEASVDTPGLHEQVTKFRDDRTKAKIDRIQAKIDSSPNSFLARQINHQRRISIQNLQQKRKVFGNHMAKHETKRRTKPEEMQKKIDSLVQKKIDAKWRKAQRKHLREEENIGRLNRMRRAEFLANMSPEDRRKITLEAIKLVRKQNIEKGRLDPTHSVDDDAETRGINEYGRTVE